MLFRILKMHVNPERIEEWLAFTRDIGFPAMLRQPGCRAIWRLRTHGSDDSFHVMTLWASAADFERFSVSEAKREMGAAAAGLTIAPANETLFNVIEDPPS
jgi:heme-degrading monooxygenase HmoA